MIYGYVRISRIQQSIEKQISNIKAAYPQAVIVQEAYSTSKTNRRKWNELFNEVKEGDMIVFESISRMATTADDAVDAYFELFDKKVNLVFLNEPFINTSIYVEILRNKIELLENEEEKNVVRINVNFKEFAQQQIRITYEQAEKERKYRRQRTREGIATARLEGKQIGQKRGNKLKVKKATRAKEIIKKYSKTFGGDLNDEECMKLAKVSRNTYYKYKNELKMEGM